MQRAEPQLPRGEPMTASAASLRGEPITASVRRADGPNDCLRAASRRLPPRGKPVSSAAWRATDGTCVRDAERVNACHPPQLPLLHACARTRIVVESGRWGGRAVGGRASARALFGSIFSIGPYFPWMFLPLPNCSWKGWLLVVSTLMKTNKSCEFNLNESLVF